MECPPASTVHLVVWIDATLRCLQEYEAWKEAHLKPGAKKPKLTEKGLRQATLSFAAPGAKEAAAGQEQAAGGKALQEKNA